MSNEREQHETRERILWAAKKEFAGKGYAGARMSSIAKKARANQALIHYYFNSKENLYQQVLYRLFGLERSELEQHDFEKFSMTAPQKLHAAIYLLVRLYTEATDPDMNRIISREVAEGRRFLNPLFRDYLIPRFERLVKVIEEGVAEGVFETRNPFLFVLQMIMFLMFISNNRETFQGSPYEERLYGEKGGERLYEYIVSQSFKGLRPEGGTLPVPPIPPEVCVDLDEFIRKIKEDQIGGTLND
ncbi:MAG: TetR/AcrR family transcriptional regulator [Spirochaetes bacterium]|nr:MAG: TetR/AcrR family transcriptional regulator [Spirochaetota bacterium]